MSCVNCSGYVCVILKILALLATFVGLGIPYWYVGDTTATTGLTGTVKTTIREGLWKTCTDLDSSSSSSSFCTSNEATTAIKVTRAMLFVSAGMLGIAILASGAAHMEKNKTAYITGGVFGILSTIKSIAALVVYAIKVKDELNFEFKHLHGGFWIVVLAVVITVVASLFAFVLARMVRGEKKKDEVEAGPSK